MRMEAKNIAAILKDKPKGIILYSPIFGECRLITVYEHTSKGDVDHIGVKVNYTEVNFDETGKFTSYGLNPHDDGEILLFPSKEMRDWSKFSWKKGDILTGNNGTREVLFHSWVNDSYTKFVGFHCLIINDNEEVEYDNGTTVFNTNDFKGIEAENAVQTYINTIEERFGGKINRDTLEIEKLEFKDGDIAFADYGNRQDAFIVSDKTDLSEGYSSFISLDLSSLTLSMGCRTSFFKKDLCKLRPATEEEKQQLFEALANEGKAWDSDKKQIVDLPKKCEFKPMDWCLMRDIRGEECFAWSLCQFAYQLKRGKYEAVGGMRFDECIPYNEETKHLLGTTDEWKGGEG